MNRVCLSVAFMTLFAPYTDAGAQSYTITPFVSSLPVYAALATDRPISRPTSIATGRAGNFYFASQEDDRVYKVAADGKLTLVAGNGKQGFIGDGGPSVAAELFGPGSLAVDRSGNLFIAD